RALAYQPEILLMDEPFASVDAQTRGELEDLLLGVWKEFGVTVLFVTHDIDESVYLGDRILVLSARPTTCRELVKVEPPRPGGQHHLDDLPLLHESRPVSDLERHLVVLLGEQDRDPALLQLQHEAGDRLHDHWRQAFGGLVHEHDPWVADESPGHREHLALAA